eukprot:scaffold10269_cov102-Isochrysis_galbana.AAC.11
MTEEKRSTITIIRCGGAARAHSAQRTHAYARALMRSAFSRRFAVGGAAYVFFGRGVVLVLGCAAAGLRASEPRRHKVRVLSLKANNVRHVFELVFC